MMKKVLTGTIIAACILLLVLTGVVLLRPKPARPVHPPPQLAVNQPKFLNKQTMVISGKTDPGVTVMVDDSPVSVNNDGSFSVTLSGDKVSSRIMRVTAIDTSGAENVMELDIIPPDS